MYILGTVVGRSGCEGPPFARRTEALRIVQQNTELFGGTIEENIGVSVEYDGWTRKFIWV